MIPKAKTISMPLNFFNFILLIFLFIIGKIKCDCSICNSNPTNCPSNCKKTLLYDNFYCEISGSETNRYFYVENSYNNGNKICHTIDKCPSQNLDKVVAKTNECVLNCADLIEIGDFCFKQDENEIDINKYKKIPFTNKYICPDYTYIKLIDEKEYHVCIDDPSKEGGVSTKCPSLYYDVDEKICKESCENKKIRQKEGKFKENESSDGINFNYYECRNQCEYLENVTGEGDSERIEKGDYEYHESLDETNSKIYCLPSCPSKAPYYYYISITNSPKCIEKCESKHFYNNDKKCSPYCENNYIVEDSKDFFKCLDNDQCNDEYPFNYQKACLKNCKDTQSTNTFNKITYSYIRIIEGEGEVEGESQNEKIEKVKMKKYV